MAELEWTAKSSLGDALEPGPSGAAVAKPGVLLAELRDFHLVQVMARRGRWQDAADAANRFFGARPPERPAAVFAPAATLIWSGPDQFQALFAQGRGTEALHGAFRGLASLSDQSHGRALFRIAGANARDMLAKVSSLDLHPEVFQVGAAAMTTIDHTGVTLWRIADDGGRPVFHILVVTSFAGSLWRLLSDSGLEYGLHSSSEPLA